MGTFLNAAQYDAEISSAHTAFPSVPVAMVKAIIATESAFRADAVRGEPQIGDASYGLMQVLYRTAQTLGYGGAATGLLDPKVNVYYGTKLLAQNIARAGNWPDAISAYNGGFRPEIGFGKRAATLLRIVTARDSTGKPTAYKQVLPGMYANQEYVNKVLGYLQQFGGGTVTSPAITTAGTGGTPAMALFALLLGGLVYLLARRFGGGL